MSNSGKLDITKSDEEEEENQPCSCSKIFFGIFNSLYWLISVGMLGFSAWQAAGATSSFTAGTSPFTYSLLTVSLLGFIMCIIGFIASIYNHLKLALTYIVVFVVLILIQIGLLLGCYVSAYPTSTDVVKQLWVESHPYMLETTASHLECCGFESWNDTYSSKSEVPAGCEDSSTSSIHTTGCGVAVITHFTTTAYPSFVTVMCMLAVIEISAFITGCVFYCKLHKEADRRAFPHSGNKIVPILIAPIGSVHGASTSSNAHSSMSAASGGDVSLNMNSPSQQSNKGNEAFLKVAGAMLAPETEAVDE